MLKNQIEKKVGQLLVIGFEGKTIPSQVKMLIHDYHIGGIILFSRNIGTPHEVLDLTDNLQKEARKAGYTYPLLICIDQENGVVRRLVEGTSTFPGAMALGATDHAENAYEIGLATGKELKALGINWNLAPVLDVNNNQDNPVIGVRSFGDRAEKVAEFGKAAMKGMQDAGILTSLKHFPGHGDTSTDSHLDLPIISHKMKRLDAIELFPFKECIHSGADTVMVGHVYFPTIEPESGIPATLSKKVITGLLREKLGFKGVITTDCMEMNAISESVGTERGAVFALQAGIDLVMISHRFDRQLGAIKKILSAIDHGEISNELIEQANERINSLKKRYLSWDDITLGNRQDVLECVGSDKHQKLAFGMFKQSVTIVKDDGVLPLATADESQTLVINPIHNRIYGAEDKGATKTSLGEAIKEYNPNVDVYQISDNLNEVEIEAIINKATTYDTIIIGTLSIVKESKQIELIEELLKIGMTVIVVAMRNPYDITYLPNVSVYINTYEFTYLALKVAAGAIFGKETVSGKLPVTLEV